MECRGAQLHCTWTERKETCTGGKRLMFEFSYFLKACNFLEKWHWLSSLFIIVWPGDPWSDGAWSGSSPQYNWTFLSLLNINTKQLSTLRNYNTIDVPRQHKQLCFRPEQVQTLQLSAVSQVAPAATLVPLVSLWNSPAPVIGQNGNSTNLLIGQTRNSTIFSLVSLICIISKCRLFCMRSILF